MEDTTKKAAVEIADLVRTAREEREITQAALAEKVGTNQQTIDKIERGKIKRSSFFYPIFIELGISLHHLTPTKGRAGGADQSLPADVPVTTSPTMLPIRGAQPREGGLIAVIREPVNLVSRPHGLVNVRDAYGILIIEASMAPEFEVGHIALVNPHLPATEGVTCIFYNDNGLATIRRLVRITADAWRVLQWNPPRGERRELSLKRSEWKTCHVTVGRYNQGY